MGLEQDLEGKRQGGEDWRAIGGLEVRALVLPEALLSRWQDTTAWLVCYPWASQAIPSAPWKDHGIFPPPNAPVGQETLLLPRYLP